jgi:hypothetical protein
MVHQAGVEPGIGQHPHLLTGGQLLEVELQAGQLVGEAPPESLKVDSRCLRRHPDAQCAQRAVASHPHDRAHPHLAGEHPAGLADQQPAGRRELDLSAAAVEQPHAQLPFQSLDRLAQRRLRDAEHVGRAAEVQLLRHHREVVQVPKKIHGPTVRDALTTLTAWRSSTVRTRICTWSTSTPVARPARARTSRSSSHPCSRS